jgi:hypothetical protein
MLASSTIDGLVSVPGLIFPAATGGSIAFTLIGGLEMSGTELAAWDSPIQYTAPGKLTQTRPGSIA